MLVVGLMSGTSADGVDAAVVELAGAPPELHWRVLAHITQPHAPELRAEILACCDPATGSVDRLCALDATLGRAFADAAQAVINAAGVDRVDLIGSHGQTVWHIPSGPHASTLQLGAAAYIAEAVGAPVVSNFRQRDMAAGGQGAPLVPLLDTLLLAHPARTRAAQNIGGIGNVTWLPPGGAGAFAFDTGPGNMLIDDAVQRATAGAEQFDQDGRWAAQGQIDQTLLDDLLRDPYFDQPPPKTTGREYFGAARGAQIWQMAQTRGLQPADLIATLTALTARSIVDAYRRWLPHMPDEVIVSGGGTSNPILMSTIMNQLARRVVLTTDRIGLPSAAKEAVAFALLAYETWHRRPGNVPAATGARRAVVLGDLTLV